MTPEESFDHCKQQYLLSLAQLTDIITTQQYADFQVQGTRLRLISKRLSATMDWCQFWEQVKMIKTIRRAE